MSFLTNLFGRKSNEVALPTREFSEEESTADYELKMEGLEHVLGKSLSLIHI